MKIQKISSGNLKNLDPFLETLCRFSLEKGAAGAGVISIHDMVFHEENPGHDPQNESTYWPCVNYGKDSMQKMLAAYQKAMVFLCTGNSSSAGRMDTLKKVYEIASKAEAFCFYSGYHLAVSLGAGNCRAIFCRQEKDCQSRTRGRGCRHPLVARPSMEACGLDPSQITQAASWKTGGGKPGSLGMVFVD